MAHQPESASSGKKGAAWRENLMTRALTGVPALILLLVLTAYAPLVLLALVVAGAGMYGYFEYAELVRAGQGFHIPRAPVIVAAAVIGTGGLLGTPQALGGGLFLAVLAVVYALWFSPAQNGEAGLAQTGAMLAGLILIPWFIAHLSLLLRLEGGRAFTAFLIVVLTMNDTLAYLVGSLLGRTPLLPAVSPNKTLEGSLGGVLGGMGVGVVAWLWVGEAFPGFSGPGLVALGALLAAAGQTGDLLESKLKRLNKAEASGRFLPGHGGLLDRLDAFLLASPLFYYVLVLWR